MPSWLPTALSPADRPKVALLVTAVASSLLTLGAYHSYTTHSRRRRHADLKQSVETHLASLPPTPVRRTLDADDGEGYHEDLIREQLARNYAFLGEEGMQKVRKSRVVVVGCGGVGSWAALMLITLSSLNRHATATLADVGTPKAVSMRKFLKSVAPWCEIEAKVVLWRSGEEGEALLEGADWVIDAIDNISTKVELLAFCHSRSIHVFSSMGAGAKSDPTRIHITDISATLEDPLARAVRRRLRTKGVHEGIPVVYSTETEGDVRLLPLPEEEFAKGKVGELGPFDDFRVRILPVLGPLPSIFGLNAATYIILSLAGKPIANPLAAKGRHKLYDKMARDLTTREARIFNNGIQKKLPISDHEIEYFFEDLSRSRSTLPPHPVLSRPVLMRWVASEPLSVENLTVLSPEDADTHEREVLRGGREPADVWGEKAEAIVERRRQEAADWRRSWMEG